MTTASMDEAEDFAYHYPPELLALLIEVIPRLSRAKRDVLLFFRGAGTPERLFADLADQLATAPDGVRKADLARTVLTRVNDGGDPLLRVRSEIVKRVCECTDFSRCWPDDQLIAHGLVARVQHVVNVKDTFTRINLERQREQQLRREGIERTAAEQADALRQRAMVQQAFFALFGEPDAHRRGKALEGVLNALFALDGLLVREAFTLRGKPGDGIIEQIDGVVQLDSHLYLVEMKWLNAPLGAGDVAQHLVRLYHRGDMRGLFLSYTPFTPAALDACRDALQQRVVSLVLLEEFVGVLNRGDNLAAMLRAKVTAAMIEKRPFLPV
ncbi:MAG: restriction endonuclease [Gemmatimonadaceae bacterium]|nr:restriction endonuclease [Gemmatimonadaceae bacterium]